MLERVLNAEASGSESKRKAQSSSGEARIRALHGLSSSQTILLGGPEDLVGIVGLQSYQYLEDQGT